MPLTTIKRRPDFLRIRGGAKWHTASFLIEGKPRAAKTDGRVASPPAGPGPARFGFTVTKKLGCAVVRNRIRRRLREAIRGLGPDRQRLGCDYVIVARVGALHRPHAGLVADLETALDQVNRRLRRGPTGR